MTQKTLKMTQKTLFSKDSNVNGPRENAFMVIFMDYELNQLFSNAHVSVLCWKEYKNIFPFQISMSSYFYAGTVFLCQVG